MPTDPATIADAGFAPGYEKRHPPRRTDAVERARIRHELAKALRGQSNEAVLADLPPEFIDPQIARIAVHLRHGHWEQAKRTLEDIERQWREYQQGLQPLADLPRKERLAAHVNRLGLNVREANAVETVCDGTIGGLLEVFPMELVDVRNTGPEFVKRIAAGLVAAELLTPKEAEEAYAAWQIARQVRGCR
jgi:hypothetical protein